MLKTKIKSNKKEYNIVRRSTNMTKTYTIIIRKDKKLNTYVAECLNLPVCAQSNNLDELRQFMIDGIKMHSESFSDIEDYSFVEQIVLESTNA